MSSPHRIDVHQHVVPPFWAKELPTHGVLPDGNAYFMFKHLKNAQLILYPDAGHGALFQYPELFVDHALRFLNFALPEQLGGNKARVVVQS
jgi:pimeloyl-ACP methyl ester carboxylesterase